MRRLSTESNQTMGSGGWSTERRGDVKGEMGTSKDRNSSVTQGAAGFSRRGIESDPDAKIAHGVVSSCAAGCVAASPISANAHTTTNPANSVTRTCAARGLTTQPEFPQRERRHQVSAEPRSFAPYLHAPSHGAGAKQHLHASRRTLQGQATMVPHRVFQTDATAASVRQSCRFQCAQRISPGSSRKRPCRLRRRSSTWSPCSTRCAPASSHPPAFHTPDL